MDQAKAGAEALSAGDYAKAVTKYTEALKVSPTSPDYLIKRSTAYQRSNPPDLQAALADANNAVRNAQNRAKRELIIQAQLRRAIALFSLERYADARFVFDIVKRMDPKEKTLAIWEKKVNDKLASSESSTTVTVKETPEEDDVPVETPTVKPNQAVAAPPAPVQTPASKIRHDWYQNNDTVVVTLLAKGVPREKANIDIQSHSLTVSFPTPDSTYDFSLDPLYAGIDPSDSTSSIMSTKVELVLKKAQPGQKWHALESSGQPSASASEPNTVQQKTPTAQAPSYPTSSRTGPKNWDNIVTSLTSKSSDAGEKGETATADDADDEEGDPVNGFFKKLYKNADPDVRRAMMKSFTESNGTALSTNWNEVQKGPVETSPPDGLEAKKW